MTKLKSFQRKNNLRLVGIKEDKGELLEIKLLGLFNGLLNQTSHFNGHTFERIHRLGAFKQGRTRVVMARFAHFKDKLTALEMRAKLKDKHGILLFDDLPEEIDKSQRKLHPVFKALQHVKESCPDVLQTVKLKNGKLILNGVYFDLDTLDKLPEDVSLDKLFTPSKDGTTAFFRCFSKLSNHYNSSFTVKGTQFSSMEQFLMYSKATFFGDGESSAKIMMDNDPENIKRLGRSVKNFDQHKWNKQMDECLFEGLSAKFEQNPELLARLEKTGNGIIIEANPSDTVFGVGLDLFNPNLWGKKAWRGKNKLGYALMKARDTLLAK